ncbi:MAG: hypothetical protein ACJ75J_16395 [Cytophagaceae bacterium]|jgi:hypothetical protein
MQKAKSTPKGKRLQSGAVPQRAGKDTGRRRTGLPGAWSNTEGQSAAIFRQLTSDVLKPKFSPVIDRVNFSERFNLQHISVKAIKKYHRVLPAAMIIKEDEKPEMVFSQLITVLNQKVQNECGPCSGLNYNEKENMLYRLDEYSDINESFEFIPLKYFTLIKNRKKALYNLIMDMVCLASKKSGIALPMQPGSEEENVLEYYQNNIDEGQMDEEDELFTLKLMAEYRNVKEFVDNILKRHVDIDEVHRKIKKYSAKGSLEKKAIKWLESGIKMVQNGRRIYDFIWSPSPIVDDYREWPVDPYLSNRFVWKTDDAVWQFMCDMMDETYNNAGAAPFYYRYAVQGNGIKKEKPQFPYMLRGFLQSGGQLAFRILKEYGPKLDK